VRSGSVDECRHRDRRRDRADVTASVSHATAEADPLSMVTLAKGLRGRVVTSAANAGPNIDMMGLWPAGQPTHLIACNEEGASEPAVQRIRLSDGAVETILSGMESCDPVRITPWGTVIVGEEETDGWLLEIQNPLQTTGVQFDRATGDLTGSNAANVATRPAVGHLAFEGIALYPNGVMYYGDEKRPFEGKPGGAYFKFVPTTPYSGSSTGLDASPLKDGQVYGLRLGLQVGWRYRVRVKPDLQIRCFNCSSEVPDTTSISASRTASTRAEDVRQQAIELVLHHSVALTCARMPASRVGSSVGTAAPARSTAASLQHTPTVRLGSRSRVV
jgi:hypothetical protein